MADWDKVLADWVQAEKACPSTPLSAVDEEACPSSTPFNAAASGIQQQVDELLTTQRQVGAGSTVRYHG